MGKESPSCRNPPAANRVQLKWMIQRLLLIWLVRWRWNLRRGRMKQEIEWLSVSSKAIDEILNTNWKKSNKNNSIAGKRPEWMSQRFVQREDCDCPDCWWTQRKNKEAEKNCLFTLCKNCSYRKTAQTSTHVKKSTGKQRCRAAFQTDHNYLINKLQRLNINAKAKKLLMQFCPRSIVRSALQAERRQGLKWFGKSWKEEQSQTG